jgi:hypothetical protein
MALTTISLKDKLLSVHAYMIINNYSIADLLYIEVVARDGVLTTQNKLVNTNGNTKTYEDVVVDYENLTVNFVNDNNDQDFAVNMFVDRAMYESMLIAMDNDINSFNNNIMSYFRININGVEEKVPVYSFESYNELFTTDINKTFRIKTLYGIGYLGLVTANDPRASEYAIVIGFNSDESPIIRYLEIIKED